MGCPYINEERVGLYWCEADHTYVDQSTFKDYCYHSLDYRSCPVWCHEEEMLRPEGKRARRTQGDNW